MRKICHFCGNKNLKQVDVQYTYTHDSKYLIVNEVPCEQCEYCGEQYFKADTIKAIEQEFDQIYVHGKKTKEEIRVPVERFIEVDAPNRVRASD